MGFLQLPLALIEAMVSLCHQNGHHVSAMSSKDPTRDTYIMSAAQVICRQTPGDQGV